MKQVGGRSVPAVVMPMTVLPGETLAVAAGRSAAADQEEEPLPFQRECIDRG